MQQAQSLHVVDEQATTETTPEHSEEPPTVPADAGAATHYDDADPVDLGEYDTHYSFPRFVGAVCKALDRDYDHEDARVVDAMPDTTDVEFGILLAFPDETLLFVGSDPTAKDAIPWFAFAIGPMEPLPTPDTAQDALDLLKPAEVRDVVHDEGWLPDRHGEWWLLPTNMVPAGSTFTPGVSSSPYGPSPLGNHVPREYAFTRSDDDFMERFGEVCPGAPATVQTPGEVIAWSWRQLNKDPTPEVAPSWADIRHCAGEVLVRGTVRHRENDHYVEKLGDQWHKALTHDVEVYTGDDMATNVHLDYHGR